MGKNLIGAGIKNKKGFELVSVSIILAILVIIFLWRVFFLGEVLLPADMINMKANPWMFDEKNIYEPYGRVHNPEMSDPIVIYYPIKSYVQSVINSGELPLWNPLSFGGYTFTDRILPDLLHPSVFLFWFIPAKYAFTFSAALYLFLAGLFTYLLARELKISIYGSLFAAVVFMFNANSVTWLEFPTHIKAELLIPLILLFMIKYFKTHQIKFAIAAGLVYGLQFWVGYFHGTQFTAIVIIIFLLAEFISQISDRRIKKDIGPFALNTIIFVLITVLVGIAFLLPFYDTFRQSIRYFQPREIAVGSPTFTYLITVAMPNFFGNNIYGHYWGGFGNYTEIIRYSGVITLFLAAVGVIFKRNKYVFSFFAVAIISILATSGTFVLNILGIIIPYFEKSSIIRILLLLPFSLALLSGYGFSAIEDNFKDLNKEKIKFKSRLENINHIIDKKRNCLMAIILVFLALFLVAIYGYMKFPHNISFKRIGDGGLARLETLSFILFFILLFFSVGFLVWFLYSKNFSKKIASFLVIGFIITDLFIYGINYNPTSPPDQIYFKTPAIEMVKEDNEKYRILGIVGNAFPPNSPWVYGFEDSAGYDPILPERYARMWRKIHGPEMVRINGKIGAGNLNENFLKLINIKYLFSKSEISSRGYFVDNFDKAKIETKQEPDKIKVDLYDRQGYFNPSIFAQPSSKITYDYYIPRGQYELVFFTYLDDEFWKEEKGDGVEFIVTLEEVGHEGKEDIIFSQVIDPINNPDDRRMYFNIVDVSKYAGKDIKISFVTDERENPKNELPIWGNPKIIPLESYGYDIFNLIYSNEVLVYRYEDYLKRAFIVHNSRVMDEGDILSILFKPSVFNPQKEVLLEEGKVISYPEDSFDNLKDSKVEISEYNYNSIKLKAESELDGYLVLLDTYTDNWRVFVNGDEREILRANYNFRAVFLEKGSHIVEFVYFPKRFYITMAITTAAIIFSVLAIVLLSIKRKKKNKKILN